MGLFRLSTCAEAKEYLVKTYEDLEMWVFRDSHGDSIISGHFCSCATVFPAFFLRFGLFNTLFPTEQFSSLLNPVLVNL